MIGGGMDPSMSVMSKSASQASSVAAGNSMSRGLVANYFDPLFDKITQAIHLPSFIYYFFLLIMFIQLMFVTTWISFSELWPSNKISKEFIKYFQYIACFSPILENTDNCSIAIIVY